MARPWLSALTPHLLRPSLWMFLPISGAISLVLLPMVALYEHTRRETLQARVQGLVEAGSERVQFTLQEVAANTGVITTVPAMSELLLAASPSPPIRQRLEAVFRAQLREYERLRALAVVSTEGRLLAQWSRDSSPLPKAAVAGALSRAQTLKPGQLWLSRVQWPAQDAPELLAARPLFSAAGKRSGLLLAVVTLTPLARDFNRITNRAPALELGYLLSDDGRTINAPPGGSTGLNFAARFPLVWQQIQRQPRGVVNTDQGLFLYLVDPLRPPAQRGAGEGLFVFDSGRQRQQLAVVIQVPADALYRTSAFAQPIGLALVALLYGLAAAGSVGLVIYRRHLEQLKQEELRLGERLEAVQSSAGVGMCLCDPVTGRFLTVNAALCAFFGRSEAELLQCTWQDLTHPEDLEADQKLAVRLHHGEFDSYRLRKRFLLRDGSSKWGDLVVACTRNPDGSIRDLIGQIADVSELVAKTAYLEAASSAGVIGVWDWDLRSNELSWDAQMYRLYGLSLPQPTRTYELWEQAVHPDDRAMAVATLQSALKRVEPFKCQFRVVWPDRSVHDIRAQGSIQFGHDGQPERMVGVNYDVTELVRKSTYLEAASSAGVVGVWDWDVASDVLTWDPVMYRLYGLRAEEFQGTRQAWERTVHPDDKAFVVQEMQAALRGWREYQPRFRVIWPDGSIHTIQARSRTTYRDDGTPMRMIGVNYDITEQVEREQEVEQQRQLLSATIDALVDPLLFLTLEEPEQSLPLLRIAEINPAAAALFRRTQLQLLGQPLSQAIPVACNPDLHQSLMSVAQGGPPWLPDETPVWLGEGQEPLYLDLRAVAMSQGLVLSFRDITARRLAIHELATSEERFRLLAENASDVVFLATLTGETEWITPSVTPLLGWAPAELEHHPFGNFVHPDDLELLEDVRASFRRGERRQFRLRVRRKDGGYHWVGVNARGVVDSDGTVTGLVGSWRDAQAEVESELALERRARTDPLTGLFNRQEILEQLEQLAHRRRANDGALAVLFCDIDHFKAINDRHGHGGGDRVLQALADRLRQNTRQGDLVGRIGGDELLVVLQSVPSLQAALAIATKIHAAAHAPLQLGDGELVPTLSIGVTLIQPEDAIDAVVARADQAMYQAKSGGRDRVIAIGVN